MKPYTLEGPDTSWVQGNLNPANFPGQFAVVNASRANVGLAVGSYYRQQIDAFRAAGRHCGHYFFNGNISPTLCATFFVNNLYAQEGDTYHLDVEDEPGTGTAHWTPGQVLEFDDVLFARTGKHLKSVYLNRSIRDAHDWSAVVARGIQLWLAYYNATLPALDEWGQPVVWQYTSAGYDHNRATDDLLSDSPVAPPQPEDDDVPLLITSPGRGYFVIGAGYSYKLRNGEDLAAALLIVSKTIAGNDRQVDLWNAQVTQGQAAGAGAPQLTPEQLNTLVAQLATSVPHEFSITGKASA